MSHSDSQSGSKSVVINNVWLLRSHLEKTGPAVNRASGGVEFKLSGCSWWCLPASRPLSNNLSTFLEHMNVAQQNGYRKIASFLSSMIIPKAAIHEDYQMSDA